MSSRNHLIGSIPITVLLVFSPCCWSLWLRAPSTTALEDFGDTMYNNNNNRQLDNEYFIGNQLLQSVPYLQKPYPQQQHSSNQRPEDTWTQVLAFLQKTVEDQKIHTVSSYLNKLLKENSDEYLPIVYEDNATPAESADKSPIDDYELTPGIVGQAEEDEDEDEDGNHDEEEVNQSNQLEGPKGDERVVEYEINDRGEVQLQKDKRSGRYYRRYPWKRRNNRYYENPKYNCKPSREEVVKLLIALHNYQNGNKDRRMVKFCKRDRPLGNIITNIRFLG